MIHIRKFWVRRGMGPSVLPKARILKITKVREAALIIQMRKVGVSSFTDSFSLCRALFR